MDVLVKIAIIAAGAIISIFIAAEAVLRLIARREHSRFAKLPPAQQRQYQESLCKAQTYFNS